MLSAHPRLFLISPCSLLSPTLGSSPFPPIKKSETHSTKLTHPSPLSLACHFPHLPVVGSLHSIQCRVLANPFVFNGHLSDAAESFGVSFLVPFSLFQGGAMDLSKVGEKILSSVRCARSLGLLPSAFESPEVPVQNVAAAAVAYAIAGLPPHQRFSLSSSSEELSSTYGSRHHGQKVEEIEEEFYEELLL